jgi:tRNA splicing endonuclease
MKTTNVKIFGFSALAVIIIVALSIFFNDYKAKQEAQFQQEQDRGNTLAVKLHQRDSLINEYVTTFNQIEKDLNYIKEKESLIGAQSEDPEFKQDTKESIIEDIQLVNTLLEQNKQKIAELEKKLKKSGIEINGLNEKMKMLAETIELRDKNIEELKVFLAEKDVELAQMNQEIVKMDSLVQVKNGVIDEKQYELNKAFVAYGNYKDLKEKGIITKEGGFLWLGQNVTLKEDFTQDQFEQIDITQTTTIPVNAREAELITEHPAGSYEWVKDNETIAYMVINNPSEFWKVSKYAVLETK